MNRYVVLLRGVNVGGYRKVPQADFKKVLENLGFCNVLIYINSGNAVFSSTDYPSVEEIQSALEKKFGFEIPTLLLTGKQVVKIANSIPNDWLNNSLSPDKTGYKSDVIYLFPRLDTLEILNQISYRPDIEQMKYVKGAVITTISRKNQSKGALQKLVSNKAIYNNITIRNVNTAKKLADLV